MPRTPLLVCLALSSLSACSSQSALHTPDGRNRTGVNSQAAIDAYRAEVATELKSIRHESQTSTQIEAVKRDILEMKIYMAAVAARLDEAPAAGNPAAHLAAPISRKSRIISKNTAETVMIDEGTIMFRVTQGVGESAFRPSTQFGDNLLRTARSAARIGIRAGSDSNVATAANVKVVEARAEQARQYLIANGVPAQKMTTKVFSAGGFVADNSTAEGKARNRRTEIEVSGLSPAETLALRTQLNEVKQ